MTAGSAAPLRRTHGPRHRIAALIAVVGVGLALTLSACSDDGPLSDVTLPSTTAPETPAETGAPPVTEQPAAPVAPTTADDELSNEDILVLMLLGAVVVAAILIITNVASSRSRSKAADRASRRSRYADVIGGYRWVHDQGTMEVLRTGEPGPLDQKWQAINQRIVELESQTSALELEAPDEETANALEDLGRTAAALRAAMDTDVALRSDSSMAHRVDLLRSSAQTVQLRRTDLNTAISNPALRIRS